MKYEYQFFIAIGLNQPGTESKSTVLKTDPALSIRPLIGFHD